MKKIKAVLLLTVGLLTGVAFGQELTVKADGVKIGFVADMQNTAGTVSGFEAKIKFDLNDLMNSTIVGSVDVSTLNTGNKKRDDHLKSADYFEQETYPKMTFTSTGFKKEGDKVVMTGKMKIKNVELEETITFTFKDNQFVGECTIQAANYDLGNFAKKKPEKTNVKISFSIPVMG